MIFTLSRTKLVIIKDCCSSAYYDDHSCVAASTLTIYVTKQIKNDFDLFKPKYSLISRLYFLDHTDVFCACFVVFYTRFTVTKQ